MRLPLFHTTRSILLLAALAAVPSAVQAQWGYALASSPAKAFYEPGPSFSYSSTAQPIQITKLAGAGNYSVKFLGIGGEPAIVQVTAYGPGSTAECKALSWKTVMADFVVDVRCFTANGFSIDASFSVLVIRSNISAGKQGYVWVDQPGAASYTAPAGKFFNTSGGNVQILHPNASSGVYTVKFLGLGGGGNWLGNVQVTAQGPLSETCSVHHWTSVGADLDVEVRCFTTAGAPADTAFAVLFEFGDGNAPAFEQAYALGDQPMAMSYAAPFQYSNGPGDIAIDKVNLAAGYYRVTFKLLGGSEAGNVQVTAYEVAKGETCKAERWATAGQDLSVLVRCYDAAGAPAEAKFSLLVEKAQ